jgi:hypothetical protein
MALRNTNIVVGLFRLFAGFWQNIGVFLLFIDLSGAVLFRRRYFPYRLKQKGLFQPRQKGLKSSHFQCRIYRISNEQFQRKMLPYICTICKPEAVCLPES